MSDKDLNKILQDKLNEHSSPVPEGVWEGVSSQIGASASATSGVAGMSLAAKVMIAAAIGGAVVASYVVIDKDVEKEGSIEVVQTQDELLEEATEQIVEVENTEENTENAVVDSKEETQADETQSYSQEVGDNNHHVLAPSSEEGVAQAVLPQAPERLNEDERRAIETAQIEAGPVGGPSPLEVKFSSNVDADQIKWTFGDGSEEEYGLTPTHVYAEPGEYVVSMIARTADGVQMDQMTIEVREPEVENEEEVETANFDVHVPNIFTPNFDGQNDVFEVSIEGAVQYSMTIYDPSGRKVFETENSAEGWEGRDLSGTILEEGTYFYVIMAVGEDDRTYTKRGYVFLKK